MDQDVADWPRRAILAVAQHVREFAPITAWDIDHVPSADEVEARASAIKTVCDEMDALAERVASEAPRAAEEIDLLCPFHLNERCTAEDIY